MTRPESLDLAGDAGTRWLGLEIRRNQQADDAHATVEFVARYRIGGHKFACYAMTFFIGTLKRQRCWFLKSPHGFRIDWRKSTPSEIGMEDMHD